MANFRETIPGYLEAVARETVGRDAAYLRRPRLVVGIELRPLTLRDYLRLSAESSPFVAGGRAGRDDVAFLLWHQRLHVRPEDDELEFAARFDDVDLGFLRASCVAYMAEALADANPGSGKSKSYYGLGASIIRTFRHHYPHSTQEEILDKPVDETFQELKAITHATSPGAVLFNRSDKIVGDWLRDRGDGSKPQAAPTPSKRKAKR